MEKYVTPFFIGMKFLWILVQEKESGIVVERGHNTHPSFCFIVFCFISTNFYHAFFISLFFCILLSLFLLFLVF